MRLDDILNDRHVLWIAASLNPSGLEVDLAQLLAVPAGDSFELMTMAEAKRAIRLLRQCGVPVARVRQAALIRGVILPSHIAMIESRYATIFGDPG